MKITYSNKANATYLEIGNKERNAVKTVEIVPDYIILDYNGENEVIGIEVIGEVVESMVELD